MTNERKERQKVEVQQVKVQYAQLCRVISDTGQFEHIVSIKRNQNGLTYKFQLNQAYPEQSPEIAIVAHRMSKVDQERLTIYLKWIAERNLNQHMIDKLVKEADLWLRQQNLHYVFQNVTNMNKTTSRKDMTIRKHNKIHEEGTKEKKPSMRTAWEVIKRIQWDEQLPIEHFAIGYKDRFKGIIERSFEDFTWIHPADTELEQLVIPQHRIQYFKFKHLYVWDKRSRQDNIFGSTPEATTILKIIDQQTSRLQGNNNNS